MIRIRHLCSGAAPRDRSTGHQAREAVKGEHSVQGAGGRSGFEQQVDDGVTPSSPSSGSPQQGDQEMDGCRFILFLWRIASDIRRVRDCRK